MSNKPNTGAMFPNLRKEKDTHPDERGVLNIECPHCKAEFEKSVAGWHRTKDGKEYTSLALSEPYRKDVPATPAPTPEPIKQNDDLPF